MLHQRLPGGAEGGGRRFLTSVSDTPAGSVSVRVFLVPGEESAWMLVDDFKRRPVDTVHLFVF